LHELLQSYGISSELPSPSFAILGIPTVFDLFVVGPDGEPLYEQDLDVIHNEIMGGEVRFSGPAARVAAGGQGPLLYTPAQLDPGSSVNHLDLYYADADPDSIMAPYVFGGWAIHDPGPITLAILKDIGWDISGLGTATRLRITTQQPGLVLTGRALPQPIRAVVQDPVGVNVQNATDVQVSLDIYGSWDPGASISCPGGRVKATDQGVAVWDGCTPTGPWKYMYFRATSPGLADGMAHVFALTSTIHRSVVPGLARTR